MDWTGLGEVWIRWSRVGLQFSEDLSGVASLIFPWFILSANRNELKCKWGLCVRLTVVKATVPQGPYDSAPPHSWRLVLSEGKQPLDYTPATHGCQYPDFNWTYWEYDRCNDSYFQNFIQNFIHRPPSLNSDWPLQIVKELWTLLHFTTL